MFDDENFYGSINQDKEREQKLMQDRRDRTHKRGVYYSIIFWMTILSIPLTVIAAIAGVAEALLFDTNIVLILLSLGAVAAGIVNIVILFLLGRDESCFTTAAIAYIALALLNTVSDFLPDGFFKVILELLSLIASLFYFFEFVNGTIYILAGVDDHLAGSWETLKKLFIYLAVGIVICVILIFIPFINILALIGMVLAALASLVLLIWQWVLVFQTSRALKNF